MTASFVESSLAVREQYERDRLRERMENEHLWAHGASTLIKRLLEFSPDHCEMRQKEGLRWVDENDVAVDLTQVEISSSVLETFLKDPIATRTLAELDVDSEDNTRLPDIFDPGNDGTIGIPDLVDGLKRLRGKPKR